MRFLFVMAVTAVVTFAFPNPPFVAGRRIGTHMLSTSSSKLHIFEDLKRFFEGPLGDGEGEEKNASASGAGGAQEDDEVAAGVSRVVTLPVTSIKLGGLRLFIMFYLMGMQNTPDKGSWTADQPSTEDYVVDFYFHDRSASLSVELTENSITIDRVGSSPSTAYLMQEATIIQGILDELDQCASDDKIETGNRLLVLQEQDAIAKAQQTLSFG